jgi:hypothetical protein
VSSQRESASRVDRRALHLLWTIPLACLVSVPLFLIANLALCGLYGCSGSGWGVATEFQFQTWVLCAIIGLLFVGAVGIPPWLRPRAARIIVAVLMGATVGGGLALYFVSQLTPNSP